MRRPSKFTEADVRRAIRAARKEGLLARVDIMRDGRISIVPLPGADAAGTEAAAGVNEWDTVGQ
jgi:hypothetical protein